MKKIITILTMSLVFISLGFSQTTLYEDDIEGLTAGQPFVAQANQTWWTTWTPGSTSEDAVVSTDYANSGVNSVQFIPDDDVILKFGDRASGKYEISFWIYVEAGQGGAYFNLQKWEEPGNEWAFNCTFEDDGTGNLQYSNLDHAFTYTNDAWVEIRNVVDLDNDIYEMYIDGTLSDTHQYSVTALGTSGVKRLGCIDFYGNTGNDFYIDDVAVIEIIASSPPVAGVDVDEIITTNANESSVINLENTGVEDLYFSAYPTYPQPVKNTSNTNSEIIKLGNYEKGVTEDFELTHILADIQFFTFASPNVRTMKEVVKFTPDQLNNIGAIGTELQSVICYIGETQLDGTPITDFNLVVYDRESVLSPGPGTILQEKAFTPSSEYGQTLVTLDSPIFLDGRDIWFGFEYTDPGMSATDTVFAFSYDNSGSGMVEGSNWLSLGVGWRSDVGGNLGIVGLASGTPINTWLTVSPSTGIIVAGDNADVTVGYDFTDMVTGAYNANVTVATNAPGETFFDIPVTLNFVSGVEDIDNSGIMTYPNPVKNMFNIVSNNIITNITATSITGQKIYNVTPNSESFEINLSNLAKGTYIFTIETANQTITRKVIVE